MLKNKSRVLRFVHSFGGNGRNFWYFVYSLAIVVCATAWHFSTPTHEELKIKSRVAQLAELIEEYLLPGEIVNLREVLDRKLSDTEVFVSMYTSTEKLFPLFAWKSDHEAFGNTLNALETLMLVTMIATSPYYKSAKIWKILIHAINTIYKKIRDTPPGETFPWNGNCYHSTITMTRVFTFVALMYRRLFKKNHKELQAIMVTTISSYLETATKSICYDDRFGTNAFMMAVPYVTAHTLSNDLEMVLENSSCKYVMDQLEFPITKSGMGYYEDGGYVFHESLRACGYLRGAARDIKFLVKYLRVGNLNFLRKFQQTFNHPTILRHYAPLFTRTNVMEISEEFSRNGRYGFETIESIRVIVAKTKNWIFTAMGQHPKLCFYETDKSDNIWGQFWTMSRIFQYKDSDTHINENIVTRYPGVISIENQRIPIDHPPKLTTKAHLPKEDANSVIVRLGDDAMALRNFWTISQFHLSVIELLLVTRSGYTIAYKISSDGDKVSGNNGDQAPGPPTGCIISVNLGEEDPRNKRKTGKEQFHIFKDNWSIIHTGEEFKYEKLEHPSPALRDTKKDICSLQCEPNSNGEVAFTTGHGALTNTTQLANHQVIATDRFIVRFRKGRLYILDRRTLDGCVGVNNLWPVDNFTVPLSEMYEMFESDFEHTDESSISDGYILFMVNKRRSHGFVTVNEERGTDGFVTPNPRINALIDKWLHDDRNEA